MSTIVTRKIGLDFEDRLGRMLGVPSPVMYCTGREGRQATAQAAEHLSLAKVSQDDARNGRFPVSSTGGVLVT